MQKIRKEGEKMSESVGKLSLELEVESDLNKQIQEAAANISKQLERAISGSGMTTQLSAILERFSKMLTANLKKAMDDLSRQIDILLKKMTQVKMPVIKVPESVAIPDTSASSPASPRGPPIPDVKVPGIKMPKLKLDFNSDIVKSQMESIEKEMDNLEAKISLQNQALKKLKAQYNNTFNDTKKTKIQEEMLKTQKSIIDMGTKMDVLGMHYTALEKKAVSYANTSKNAFTKAGAGIVIPSINTAPQTAQIKGLTDKVGMLGVDLKRTATPLQNMGALLKRTFSVAGIKNLMSSLSKLPPTANKTSRSFSSLIPKLNLFSRSAKSAKASNNQFNQGLGNTVKQMFKWMIVLPMIVKGLTAMATSLFQSLQTNDQFNNSLAQIKSNLMVAFTPILQAILPAINALMSALAKATAYVASFISQLFGKTFSQSFGATQQLISAKDAMGVYGTTSQKAAKGVKQATKANEGLKRSLMGFDQINKLDDNSSQTDADMSDTDSGEVSNAPVLVKPMIDTSLLDATTIPWVNKFKDVLSRIFQPFRESWGAEGANTISAMKSALDSVWTLIKDIGKSFLSVWTNGTGTIILTNILQIFQNIFNIIKNIASGLSEAWNENGNGTAIIQSVLDIFNIVLDTINRIAGATVEWAEKLNFSPLLESVRTLLESLEPLAQNIGDGLAWFWENVLLPIAGWAIETAVPTFLDMLSAAIDALNSVIDALKPLGAWLFDNLLKPLGEWAGELFIGAMQTVTDLLKKFSDWCTNNQETIQTVATIIGSFVAAWGIVSLATTIAGIVTALAGFITAGGLAAGVATLLGGAIAFLTSPVTIAVAIIGALIAIGVLLWQNWDAVKAKAIEIWGAIKEWFGTTIDTIKAFFPGLWEGIKEAFSDTANWFKGIFTSAWEGIKIAFSSVGSFFTGVWDSVKQIFSGVIDFVTGVFTGNWQKAWQGLQDIFSGIVGGLASIIKAPLNGIIGLINMAIDGLNSISFDLPEILGGGHVGLNIPKIPYLAKGGVISQPTLAMMGEAGKEAVVPLENNTGWTRQVAKEIGQQGGSGGSDLSPEMIRLLMEILRILKDMPFVKINEEALRKYFIATTNKNTMSRGKSELIGG